MIPEPREPQRTEEPAPPPSAETAPGRAPLHDGEPAWKTPQDAVELERMFGLPAREP